MSPTYADLFSFVISAALCAANFKTKHYMLNNILGLCFSVLAIETVSITSFKIAAVLLIGMFIYDIYWVYGTEVMVTVAKSIDIPAKLLFPVVRAPVIYFTAVMIISPCRNSLTVIKKGNLAC